MTSMSLINTDAPQGAVRVINEHFPFHVGVVSANGKYHFLPAINGGVSMESI